MTLKINWFLGTKLTILALKEDFTHVDLQSWGAWPEPVIP